VLKSEVLELELSYVDFSSFDVKKTKKNNNKNVNKANYERRNLRQAALTR
jgi:hypothetical protein